MSGLIMVVFHFFVSELWPFDCVCLLFFVILINVQPITRFHLTVTKFYRNVYQGKSICCVQE